MDKIIRRAEYVARHASRREARSQAEVKRMEKWERTQQNQTLIKYTNQLVRDARKRRVEDWNTGRLAPRRDVGLQKARYGTVDVYHIGETEKHEGDRPDWFPIASGDRVVLLKGRDRGKIGKVNDVGEKDVTVKVANCNVADVFVPDWLIKEESMRSQRTQQIDFPIPLKDVRLVFPLPDAETGVPRDVIMERLMPINRVWDEVKEKWSRGDRVIPGTNTIIPWPEVEEPDEVDYEIDTLRITVEDITFRPYLLAPPMPLSVIDELRSKYSKLRTRHDYDFIEKVEARAAKEELRKELAKKMRTPLQELRDKRIEEAARTKEKAELSEQQLTRIGEVIATEQAKVRERIAELD